jgi:uncharacterized protein (TIGR02996 family)
MDSTQTRLLDAVLAAPEDDEPRLVYADWLMERGDPRGEFITVQCTEARLRREGKRATPAYRAAANRSRAIEREHLRKWVDAVGLRRWWGQFERGFVTQLTISPKALRSKWGSVFSRWPLEHLRLQPQGPAAAGGSPTLGDLAWLAAQPETERLRLLTVDTSWGTSLTLDWAAVARPLLHNHSVDDPAIAVRQELALGVDPIHQAARAVSIRTTTPDHIADLNRRCPPAPMLRSLNLSTLSAGVDAADMAVLMATPELRGLEELQLWQAPDDVAAVVVENHPRAPARFPNLHTLQIRSPDPGPNLLRALATNKSLPNLTTLLLPLALDDGLTEILENRTAKLETLTLQGRSNDAAVTGFARAKFLRRLRSLSLFGSEAGFFGAPSIRPLLRPDAFAGLESLSLNAFLIGDANAEAMKNTPWLSTIVSLSLVRCSLNDARMKMIAASPYLNVLVSLNVQENAALTKEAAADLRARWPDAEITT